MRDLSAEHLAALAATVAVSALLVAGARRNGPAFSRPARIVLGAVILAGFATEQLAYAERGLWSARVNLPFQLSDAVALVSVAALWRPRPVLVELVYYWAFAATLQALLTPDLRQAYPDVLYFTYFTTHGGALTAACLLVLGERRRPRAGSALRAFAVTAGFAILAAVATLATGGNYLFLRRKPAGGSLLDAMGPWPVYIAAAAALGLVLFLALEALARHYPGPDAQGTARTGRRAAGRDAGG
jgi:hypothetical integral membrane protein (TIGR02206 family)